MRKTARNSSSKPTSKPARRSLPLNRETIRTLTSEQLVEVVTGIQISCPTGQSWTETQATKAPPRDE